MEKYRKFDDPRVGVNPFVNLPETVHSPLMMTGRFVSFYIETLILRLVNQSDTKFHQTAFLAVYTVQHNVYEPGKICRKYQI